MNAFLFQTLDEVRYQAETCRQDYNEKRSHESLGYVPLVEYQANSGLIKSEF